MGQYKTNHKIEGEWLYFFIEEFCEKVRCHHRTVSLGVLIVLGVNSEGQRSILAAAVIHGVNESDYNDLFKYLHARALACDSLNYETQ